MKKGLIGFAAIMLLVAGCSALNKLTQFRIPYSTNSSIPATPGGTSNIALDITTPKVNTDINNQLKKNNTDGSLLQSVKLDEFVLNITAPAGKEFNFLSSIRVFLQAQGLSEVEVAYKNNVAAITGSQLTMDLTGAELKNHLLKDSINFRVTGVSADSIPVPIDLKADFKVFVDAKILGI